VLSSVLSSGFVYRDNALERGKLLTHERL
jgi:hypothetical protein